MYNLLKIIAFSLVFGVFNLGFAQTFAEIEAKLKKTDYANAHQELSPLIEQGNAEAQNLLGEIYNGHFDDDDLEPDIAEAEKWYKLAAEQNLLKAQLNLGNLYKNIADTFYSFGLWRMPADYQLSEEDRQHFNHINEMWRKLAIEYGNYEVKADTNMLGKYRPRVDNEIYKEALKWFKKLADQNDAAGQYNVCSFYAGGLGIKKDFKEATKWCKLADKQKYSEAQDMLQYIEKTQKICSEIFADKKRLEEYKNQHRFFIKPDCEF